MRDLERRVQRLEAERGADEEVSLEEAVLWSMREGPLDAETQRQYDEFLRRLERSKLRRFLKEAGSRHAPNLDCAHERIGEQECPTHRAQKLAALICAWSAHLHTGQRS